MARQRPGSTTPKSMSRAEREIRSAQADKIAAHEAADEADEALKDAVKKHLGDGTPVAEIGTWLASPDKPNGVSRQQVYNIIKDKTAPAKAVVKTKVKPRRRRT